MSTPEFPPEEQAELDAFLRQHGIVPEAERIETFLEEMTPEAKERFNAHYEEIEKLKEKLAAAAPVSRLKGLLQLAGKTIDEGDISFFMATPAFHSRLDHSESVALHAEVIGARLGLSLQEIKNLVAGALLHDVGHSAFSHTGDTLLIEHGLPPHEERSIAIIENDEEIKAAIGEENLEEVIRIVKEEGALGALQSAIDTFSYLEMDSKMLGKESLPAWHFIENISEVDETTDALIVKNPELWQILLDQRALAMKEIYYNRKHKIAEEATRQLLRTALNKELISLSDIEGGTDIDLRLHLQSLVQEDPGAAKASGRNDTTPHLEESKDLYSFSLGFEPEGWSTVECETLGEANGLLSRLPAEKIPSSFVVSPYDYTKKTLAVAIEKNQTPLILRSSIILDPEEKKYIACFKK